MNLVWMLCTYWCANAFAEPVSTYILENTNLYFQDYMTKFNKQYVDEKEKEAHAVIFKDNLEMINRLNQKSDHAVYGINKYMDLTFDEFSNKIKCLQGNITDRNPICRMLYDSDITEEDAPDSFDWRQSNAVTAVKNQGDCRSCYAFSACGQLEGQNAIKNKKLVDLSPQQIVDCDTRSQRCRGGFMSAAFSSLLELGGSMKNKDYPYLNMSRKCRSKRDKTVVKLISCSSYDLKSQEKLKQLLYYRGPIAVGLTGQDGMIFYEKGIIMDSQSGYGPINHAVLLVGYGTEKGIPYWTCKNSLGSEWGEAGYFRLQRGENAHSCGLLNKFMATADIEYT